MDSVEYNCQLCSDPDSADNMVACDICENWFHFMCAGVDSFVKNQDFACAACAGAQYLPKGHSTPTLSHNSATTLMPATTGDGSAPFMARSGATQPPNTNMCVEQAKSTQTSEVVSSFTGIPATSGELLANAARASHLLLTEINDEPLSSELGSQIITSMTMARGNPTSTLVHHSFTQPLSSHTYCLPTDAPKRSSVFIDVSPSKVQPKYPPSTSHALRLSTPAEHTLAASEVPNHMSTAVSQVPGLNVKQSSKTRVASITSKGMSSKSSQRRKMDIELRKLEEEKALEKEFLNRKYKILSEIEEGTSGSEIDDDISTDTNSKVQDWLKDKHPSQVHKESDHKAVAKPLNPKGHCPSVGHTWLGAYVKQQQPPQLSTNPWDQPITTSQQTFVHSSVLPSVVTSVAPPQSQYNRQFKEASNAQQYNRHYEDVANAQKWPSVGNYNPENTFNIHQRPPNMPQQQPSSYVDQHQASFTRITSNQIAARHSILKDLRSFNGNPEEWPSFIANFNRTTRLCGFTDEENLLRLQKVLKDKAFEAVQSLINNPNCVPRILSVLEMLFGKPDKILNCLTLKIQSTPSPKAEKLDTLVQFAVAVQNHCAALEGAGLSSHLNNSSLLQELVAKLPVPIQLNWAIYMQTLPVCTLSEFSVWMYRIAEAANCITPMPIKTTTTSNGTLTAAKGKKEKGFLHAHLEAREETSSSNSSSTQEVKNRKCLVCGNNCTSVDNCDKFKDLNITSKWETVRKYKLCRCCLRRHNGYRCRSASMCGKNNCNLKHNKLLHNDQPDKGNLQTSKNVVSPILAQPSNAHIQNSTAVMYRIVPVILHGNKIQIKTYAFLDDGSSLTLMDEDVAAQLNMKGTPDPLCIKWTANTHRYEDDSRVMNLNISGTSDKCKIFALTNVHTVKSLQLPLQSLDAVRLQEQFEHLRRIPIEPYSNAAPRLLIGLNNWKLGLTLKCKEGNIDEPVAAKTRLGWTIYGCCPHPGSLTPPGNTNGNINVHICECSRESEFKLEHLVNEFMCNEKFGSSDSKILQSTDDQRALEQLQNNTTRKNGRFETGLLWKYDQVQLPDSYKMARKRLMCIQQRMSRDLQLAEELHNKIESYVTKGYAKKLSVQEAADDRSNSWYLPIFPVKNPNKPGKVRLVWDAAAVVDGISLNSVLLKGPDLLASLMSVIIKFRQRRFAICADIQEMFHQIRIRTKDQNYQRFLWFNRDSNEVEEYIMLVMTFGATCSPCSAQFIKNKNAEDFESEFPRAVKSIRENHYVDDLMDSVDSETEAVRLAQEITFIHQQGGFHIRNWISNSKEINETFQSSSPAEVNLNTHTELAPEKVLGMWWSTTEDYLTFKITISSANADLLQGGKVPTKREVLQILMKVFDPLGLVANFLMYGKILLQEIWRSGIGWDDPIKEAEFIKWCHWLNLLPQIEEVRIPRCYISSNFVFYPDFELHVFVDASENGFAAVAYARMVSSDFVECTLIGAKTKVAPLKSLSIPRLELQAAVLGARLAKKMYECHSINFQKQFFWSDSRTVLSWLRSDHRRYRQFVAVRVSEILDITQIDDWRWVPTKLNVADEATKWQKVPNFKTSSPWFKGPAFLMLPPECWPKEESTKITTNEELKAQFVGLHCLEDRRLFKPELYSDWSRLLHFAGRVVRIAFNWKMSKTKRDRRTGPLTKEELNRAEQTLFKQAQYDVFSEEIACLSSRGKINKSSSIVSLSPFLDENEVLRANSRIQSYVELFADVRGPIILPSHHYITNLVVQEYHVLYHHKNHETVVNELRQKFHICQLRAVLSKVRKNCQICKNAAAEPRPPMMAELPVARVSAFSRPFSFTGVDYFGPMLVVNLRRTEKRYGVLLTCLTTRAIHIEIAYSLTTDSCILAIRNFMARRGTPIELFSDNGTNFKGAERELKEAYKDIDNDKLIRTFTSVNTKWTFIPPGSPHMGGSWERLVRSVKTVLKQITPSRNPSDELLRSMLLEVENIVNSRPLTYIPIACENDEALTPNHFLVGTSNGSKPWAVFNNEKEVLRKNWLISQSYAQHFWRRWVNEYLPTITRRTKWFAPVKPIEKDDIVFIVDSGSPRNCWLKGRVIETKISKDGQVRSATVLTKAGIYERPAVKLAVLDVRKESEVGPLPLVDIPGGGVAHAPLRLTSPETSQHV